MKIPNKLIKFLLKKETSVLLPKRIIRLIIKKNRVFFLKTTLFKLPKNNYPFILSQSELNQFFSISKNYKFELPLTEFPQLALVLNLIFNKKKKFKFLDFGEVAEWFKAHAWKVCVPSQVPWVRIPLSPPLI